MSGIATDWFWTEVALLHDRWDVLRHSFYRRWSAGRLTPGELQLDAGEYHHAVIAIAQASRRAADPADGDIRRDLERHAEEELEHIDPWMRFARGTGSCAGGVWVFSEDPYEETRAGAGLGRRAVAVAARAPRRAVRDRVGPAADRRDKAHGPARALRIRGRAGDGVLPPARRDRPPSRGARARGVHVHRRRRGPVRPAPRG